MRKFGLIFLMIALFALVFAISVSAAEIPEWTEITEVEGMGDKAAFGEDGTKGATSRVMMNDGKTYPSYYIFKDSTTLSVDFTEINKKTGMSYARANVVRLEIPNGLTTLVRLQSYTSLLEVTVPEGVTDVVTSFLESQTTVVSVKLPSTIKSIGNMAFYKIGAVEEFIIPEGCEAIGRLAFKLSGIQSVVIPSTIKEEGMSTEVFYECKSLKNVVCKAPIISSQMFKLCSALENVTLENTKEIGEQAFHSCGAFDLVIPENCTTIKNYAFKSASIKSAVIPTTITSIGTDAFALCTGLKKVEYKAPKVLAKAFYECTSIEEIILENTIEIETYAFYKCGAVANLVIPEGCTTIGKAAFKNSGILSVTIPASAVNLDSEIFLGNASLQEIHHKSSVAGSYMYKDCSAVTVLEIGDLVTAGAYSFYNLPLITELVLPETLTTVGEFAFAKLGICELVVPKNVSSMGKSAFYSNYSLERVVVLGSVIGESAFSGCALLDELYITSRLTTFSTTNPFNGTPQSGFVTYFAGDDYEAVKKLLSTNIRFQGPACAYADYKPEDYSGKNVFIYSADICALMFGGHEEDNNACVINCTRCAITGVAEKNPIHSEKAVITYASYDKNGVRAVVCTNEGCSHRLEESVNAIFECLGYSAPEFGDGGVAVFYLVDYDAMAEFTKNTGKSFEFGVFAVTESAIGDKEIINANGEKAEGVIAWDLTQNTPQAFEIKVIGFSTAEQKNVELVLGAYIVEKDGENKSISYSQAEKPTEGKKYNSVSYNDIVNSK